MSKHLSKEEYDKTLSGRFRIWLSGSKDPFVGTVEMKEQHKEEVKTMGTLERMSKEQRMLDEVYNIGGNKVLSRADKAYKVFSIIFCLIFIGLMLWSVSDMPAFGDASNPTNNEIVERYIENGLQETGAVNIVAGMILTYRAFDTFGETNVLFIATCCVMILLMLEESVLEKAEEDNDRKREPKNDKILQLSARVLCPVIFIFGIYVILNGHLSPGGGFSGGSILGAGLILYVSAFGFKKTQRFFNEAIYKVAKISALCMYGLIGSYFYITGANGIANHIPLGIPGHILSSGIILPINIAVGLEVACTMYAFYALFRRGGL